MLRLETVVIEGALKNPACSRATLHDIVQYHYGKGYFRQPYIDNVIDMLVQGKYLILDSGRYYWPFDAVPADVLIKLISTSPGGNLKGAACAEVLRRLEERE